MTVPTVITDLNATPASNSPVGTETAKGNIDNYLRAHAAFIKQLYDVQSALIGTDTAATLNAYGCRGLAGAPNAASPLTRYDLAANAVVLRNAPGVTLSRLSTGALTCDLALAGAVVNGRDQAGAFTAASWVYLYFIWNGTTLATIASASATAPTLPTGYTHYCFATALRWNGSSNIVPAYTRGSSVMYRTIQNILASGASTTEASVDLSTLTPPGALKTRLAVESFNASAGIGSYPNEIRVFSTAQFLRVMVGVAVVGGVANQEIVTDVPNIAQNIYYICNAGTLMSIWVNGYTVANGGE